MSKVYLPIFILLVFGAIAWAQTTSLNQTVRVWAQVQQDNIELLWPKDKRAGSYTILRKEHFSNQTWQTLAQLPDSAESYTDATAQKGTLYDYQITKSQVAQGYACAAMNFVPSDLNGTILLMVEDEIWQSVKDAVSQFNTALWAEGWKVRVWRISNSLPVATVKEQIIHLDSVIPDLEALLIVGHVPVPYSGDWMFDGHTDHKGAWPADVFYGTFGKWTDTQVNNATARRTQNQNIPDDRKYDQTYLPSVCRYQIGRIDFQDIKVGDKTPAQLIESYISRNLSFRKGKTPYQPKGLVDDNFTGLNLAATGWANLSNLFGANNVTNEDYFSTLQEQNYLFSYGCGAGSYTSCGGIGTSADFISKPLKHSFTLLAGSYFGDWDSQNNLMRTAVATSALACGWGGIPKWYIQHTALGLTLGYGVRLTQNNSTVFFNGNFNSSANAIHIALMGDPTLRLFPIAAPENLSYLEQGNQIKMTWSGEASAYLVYRIDTVAQSIVRLTSQPIESLEFTTPKFIGNYLYSVRAVKTQTTGAGSFQNLSAGSVLFTSFTTGIERQLPDFVVYPNPSKSGFNIQSEKRPTHLEIFDSQGFLVFEGLQTHYLNLEKGLYLLKIYWPDGRFSTHKWLKE